MSMTGMVADQCGIANKAKWREQIEAVSLTSNRAEPLHFKFTLKFKFKRCPLPVDCESVGTLDRALCVANSTALSVISSWSLLIK
jgi:hypothetical protein